MHNFLDEMKMVEAKLNVINHSMKSCPSDYWSNSSISTKIEKRKRIHTISTEKDVLTGELSDDDNVSQSRSKHLKFD